MAAMVVTERHMTREQIEAVIRHEVREIFTVDLDRLRNGLTKLPWVRTATVRRVWRRAWK